jgi:DNA-binding SARP family transcriptional activator/tetratricopeptide (TPR) repeat protein
MEFRILGNLEAETEGGRLALGGPAEQKVLATLLLDAGRTVPLTRLSATLWVDHPPATAGKQVRNAVSRLRSFLAQGGAPDLIETGPASYRLILGTAGLDAHRFNTKVCHAESAASVGQRAEAARLLRSALEEWRGPFLTGMTGQVIEMAAVAWNERRWAVTESYYDHQLALGLYHEIISELSGLVADQPLREKPVGQLMRALHGCGRRADALALYRRTRTLLADETGLDPSPALQQLHQQVLTGDPSLPAGSAADASFPAVPSVTGAADHAPLQGHPVVPRQLPGAVRHFTGRQDELRALNAVLPETGRDGGTVVISAIDGTAGIGKTALAVQWAHQVAGRFPDGQLYVNLRGYGPSGQPAEPAWVIRYFLAALGIPPARIPPDLDAQAALYRSVLAGRRMLIVLDNAKDAAHVRPLLPGSPHCLIIVTSRSQLTSLVVTEGANRLTLDLLSEEEGRQLLAHHLGPRRTSAEAIAVKELITLCARLPLALSIAGARISGQPRLPLGAVLPDLRDSRDRLETLDGGDAATNVRAVFSWSYRNLTTAAARTFRLLGVHPGPDATVAAAASLAGIHLREARGALHELSRAHLVTENSPGRFGFHDLLRAYAVDQARVHDSGAERDAALRRLLDHYVHSAHAAALLVDPARDRLPLGAPQPGTMPEAAAGREQALAWFQAEHHVLLAVTALAADARSDTCAWQLPWTLADFLHWQGHWHDLAAAQGVALAAAQRLGDLAREAQSHRYLGRAFIRLGRHDDAHACFRRALDLHTQLGDHAGQVRVHLDTANVLVQQGRKAEALAHAEQSLELARRAGHRPMEARALNGVGWSHAVLGHHQCAIASCERALDLYREAGNRPGEAAAWHSLGYVRHQLADYRRAHTCYAHALDLYRQLGDRYQEADTIARRGDTYDAAGDPGTARESWQEALAILDDLHHPDADQVRARLSRLGRGAASLAT